MKITQFVLPVIAAGFVAGSAQAALTFNVSSDSATLPGFVINTITVDTSSDVTGAEALSNLSSGTVHNTNAAGPHTSSDSTGDTFVTINNDAATTLAGPAVDFGGTTVGGTAGTTTLSLIDALWINTATTDIGAAVTVAVFTFSDDADGTLDMAVSSADDGVVLSPFTFIVDGVLSDSGAQPLLGDANKDGQVTGADLISVQQNFGNVGPTPLQGDANNDGQVTGADLISVQQNFGNVAAPAASPVPEPTTLGLLAAVIAPLGLQRRFRAPVFRVR